MTRTTEIILDELNQKEDFKINYSLLKLGSINN